MKADDTDEVALHSVTSHLAALLASIEFDQWNLATPCSEWDLAALVDHLTGGNWFTNAILAGEQADEAVAATMERFGGGSATSLEAIQSLEDQTRAFLRPGALDRTWNHVAGDLSGRQILRLRLHDLIVHSWDVEETLRPGATLPDGLLAWGLEELFLDDSLTTQHFDLTDIPVLRSSAIGTPAYIRMFGR